MSAEEDLGLVSVAAVAMASVRREETPIPACAYQRVDGQFLGGLFFEVEIASQPTVAEDGLARCLVSFSH